VRVDGSSSRWLTPFGGRFGSLLNVGVVFIGQDRWADFVFAALLANHADQFAAADLQIVILAKLVELLQVDAGHGNYSVI
jgi:hypothetical protein